MKKHLIALLAVVCIAAFIFVACSTNAAHDEAEPVDAPAATALEAAL